MDVTLDGIVIEVNPDDWNALFPMDVTLDGIIIELKHLTFVNALFGILVIPDSIINCKLFNW